MALVKQIARAGMIGYAGYEVGSSLRKDDGSQPIVFNVDPALVNIPRHEVKLNNNDREFFCFIVIIILLCAFLFAVAYMVRRKKIPRRISVTV